LDQFQARYTTGNLISELLQIHQGKFVVRVSAQVEGITRATGMAAAQTLELAEDRARSRALMVLGIEISTGAMQPETFPLQPTTSELPSELTASLPVEGLVHKHQSPSLVSKPSLNSSIYPSAISQVPSEASLLAPTSSFGLKNERLPLTAEGQSTQAPPLHGGVPSGFAVACGGASPEGGFPSVGDWRWKPSRSAVSPLTATPSDQGSGTFSEDLRNTPTKDSSQEELPLPLSNVTSMGSRRPNHQDIVGLNRAVPEPEDLSDAIAQTDIELARLSWSPAAGRDYLIHTYGKRARKLLTQKELLEFLKYLKSQPTPKEPLS